MTTTYLMTALVLLGIALTVGALDGLYFHLWKFRLYARPASQTEHLTHTIRAWLLAPMIWFAFVSPNLWALIGVVAVDSLVVLTDVSIENASRSELGGMPTAEYLVHVISASFHSAAVALAIAFWWEPRAVELPALVRDGGLLLIASALPVALLHVVLSIWKPGAPAAVMPPPA